MRQLITLVMALFVTGIVMTAIPEGTTEAHSGNWTVVKGGGTFLRTCPATSCRRVVLVGNGDTVRLDRHRGNWAYAYYGDFKGWLSLGTVRQVAAAPAAPSQPVTTGSQACFGNTWGATVCAPQWMADEIANAASYYGVSYWTLMSVAACESNFDPATTGWAGEVGIFQWIDSTWAWIGRGDRYSTYDQIWATAWAFANGYDSHWTCYYRI